MATLEEYAPRLAAAVADLDRLEPDGDVAEVAYWCRAVLDGLAGLAREPAVAPGSLQALAARMRAFVDGMRFEFLYDRRRRIFAIGYRLADADGPGRLDGRSTTCWPPKRGSPASSRSPRATCRSSTGSTSDAW